MEKTLRESQAKYAAIVNAFDGFICIISRDYIIEFLNKKFVKKLKEIPIGKKCYNYIFGFDSICPFCSNRKIEEIEIFKARIYIPKEDKWYNITQTPIYYGKNQISLMSVFEDITKIVKNEEELELYRSDLEELVLIRENKSIFKLELERIVFDISTKLINCEYQQIDQIINNGLKIIGEFLNVDHIYLYQLSKNENLLTQTHNWFAKNYTPRKKLKTLISQEHFPSWLEILKNFENVYFPRIPDKNVKSNCSLFLFPLPLKGVLFGYIGYESIQKINWSDEIIALLNTLGEIIVSTINRKQQDEIIHKSLREKDILLKEIHHRVKNNLQIISGLLYLQTIYNSDPNLKIFFDNSKNRIKTMSLLHEQLYQSQNFVEVNFSDYIEKLLENLYINYGINRNIIKYSIQTNNIYLDFNTTIPCGLILNELVSNSLKYAFPDNHSGLIQISMDFFDKNTIIFEIKDNGIGFPTDFNMEESESLGLDLVKDFINQLSGTYEINLKKPTSFKIKFPIKKKTL